MNIQVNAFSMSPSCLTVGTKGSYGIPKLEFRFSSEWSNLSKKASFYVGNTQYAVIIGANNTAVIPSELMANAGEYPFLVSGSRGSDLIISLAGKITVLPTLTPAVTPPGSPTPTEMEQIYDILEETQALSSSAASSIEAANVAAAAANSNAAAANNAAAAARVAAADATAAAAAVVSVTGAAIDGGGHLQLTLSNGTTVDTGVARGCAFSGSYVGNGSTLSVNIGFRPALLLISRVDATDKYYTESSSAVIGGDGLRSGATDLVAMTVCGFTLTQSGENGQNRSGEHYRYVAFADDATVLSSAVAQKITRPESFESGSIPVFNAAGDLVDGGVMLNGLAGGILLESGVDSYHEITDCAGGHPVSVLFYGTIDTSGTPSKQNPLYPEFASSLSLEVESGDYAGRVSAEGVTLRALEVSGSEPYNYSAKVGRVLRYYRGDTLSDSGVLRRMVGYLEFDGSEDWHIGSNSNIFYLNIPNARVGNPHRFHCSHYNRIVNYSDAAFAASNCLAVMHPSYPRLCISDNAFGSLQAFQSYLAAQKSAGTPVRLWYQLADFQQSSVTIESPLTLTLPKGSFEIWSDACFDFSYVADTKTYIDERIAALQSAVDALADT